MTATIGATPDVSPGNDDQTGATGGAQPAGFKQAKGVITRKAMEAQLQKKLQIAGKSDVIIGDKQDLLALQAIDKDVKI